MRYTMICLIPMLLLVKQSEIRPDNKIQIQIEVTLDKKVYRKSLFGEPPQMAVWIESDSGEQFNSLWVTKRMATGRWAGKFECISCLPYWTSRRKKLAGQELPTQQEPLPDGITGATPAENLKIIRSIKKDSDFEIFIELNISGDFNPSFPASDDRGIPDHEGDGQPALVYRGKYTASPKKIFQPEIIGYVVRRDKEIFIEEDFSPITTAKNIIESIHISFTN